MRLRVRLRVQVQVLVQEAGMGWRSQARSWGPNPELLGQFLRVRKLAAPSWRKKEWRLTVWHAARKRRKCRFLPVACHHCLMTRIYTRPRRLPTWAALPRKQPRRNNDRRLPDLILTAGYVGDGVQRHGCELRCVAVVLLQSRQK